MYAELARPTNWTSSHWCSDALTSWTRIRRRRPLRRKQGCCRSFMYGTFREGNATHEPVAQWFGGLVNEVRYEGHAWEPNEARHHYSVHEHDRAA